MIAKLITYGRNRAQAIESMQSALGEYVIRGISHNISFLEALIAHKRFASGDINTNFIAQEYPDGFFGAELTSETTRVFLAVAAHIYLDDATRAARISGQMPGRERHISNRWVVSIDEDHYPIIARPTDGGYNIRFETEHLEIRSNWMLGNVLFQGTLNGRSIYVHIEHFAGGYFLTHAGSRVRICVQSPRAAELSNFMPKPIDSSNATEIEAPISGMVVDILVKEGEAVKKGQDLFILEAMKMENVIYAERDAEIKKIHLKKGDSTTYGQVVLEFK